ncbi:putative thioredoxin-like protein [Helianthus annuus]|nr:putative thioredoxin-like protein [Helianthus annuus]
MFIFPRLNLKIPASAHFFVCFARFILERDNYLYYFWIVVFVSLMKKKKKKKRQRLTLVTRKACFGLPTACPSCLPVYIYLKLAKVPFDLSYNLTFPDSDQIPYVDADTYVAYNNEKGGVIESLKEDNIVNLDSEVQNLPEWVSALAMINSWLSDAILYELWVASDGSSAHKIYYSDLPWPIGKLLYLKQVYNVKQLLGISKDNAERREEEKKKKKKKKKKKEKKKKITCYKNI